MYFYIVREVLPKMVFLGVGFVLLGLLIAATVVIWKAAQHLAQKFGASRSRCAYLVARWREGAPGAQASSQLAQASIAARRTRRI
jgi:hypothetical protein